MVDVLARWALVVTLLFGGERGLFAAAPAGGENSTYQAAAEAFKGGFYQRAEADLGEFIRQYPASALLPEAVLLQAQARVQMTNYDGAIELLTKFLPSAAAFTDHYLFWMAEARLRKGEYQQAAEGYARLIREHPGSSRALEAALSEATAQARLSNWPRVTALLQQTNGIFQSAVHSAPTNGLVTRGFLLLSEAQFMQRDYAAAGAALRPLANLPLPARLDWQRWYLTCRIQLAEGRLEEALQSTTNLVALAGTNAPSALQADTAAFRAGVLERLGRPEEAMQLYQSNLAESVPAERQREALLKTTELSMARTNRAGAIAMLQQFTTRFPGAAAADLALLTIGELRMAEHQAGGATDGVPGTNGLSQALAALNTLIRNYPQSVHYAKAQLDRGWCFWFERRLPESLAAFQIACERLPESAERATACFKVADAQFELGDYTNALKNYSLVSEKYSTIPEVKTNLAEKALYQSVQAGRALGDVAAVTNALAKLLKGFPGGALADRALLLAGGEVGRRANPSAARDLFLWAITNSPNADLLPQLELAVARTYEQEDKWAEATRYYDGWLGRYTNHAARTRAEYDRARAISQQVGQETNALAGFTNFISLHPGSELAPLAQWWVADYFFRNGDHLEAEKNYQALAKHTNWAGSELSYQAQLMAGRAAMARLGWEDADDYFLNLYNDTNCPTELRVQALFGYGDYWMSRDSTNKLADYDQAIAAFNGICTRHPTNRLAVLALGKVASCYLQKAQTALDYELAATNFQTVAASPLADATVRSIAKVGLAIVREKQAQQRSGAEQVALRREALDLYLDVFYRKILRDGEQPDAFWTRKAGLEAAALAESLQDWSGAINVYRQLQEMLPPLRSKFDRNILRAQEQMAKGGG